MLIRPFPKDEDLKQRIQQLYDTKNNNELYDLLISRKVLTPLCATCGGRDNLMRSWVAYLISEKFEI